MVCTHNLRDKTSLSILLNATCFTLLQGDALGNSSVAVGVQPPLESLSVAC
jgi:hypothetical protein